MATVPQIRDALKTRLSSISTLNVYDTVPGQIEPPAAVIRRRSGPRPDSLGVASVIYTFTVTLFTSFADQESSQDTLDAYVSPSGASSILAALEADPTLGGVVHQAALLDIEPDQVIEYANAQYVGCDAIVEVLD